MEIRRRILTNLEECPKCGSHALVPCSAMLSLFKVKSGPEKGKLTMYLFNKVNGAQFKCSNETCDAEFGFKGGYLVCLNEDTGYRR